MELLVTDKEEVEAETSKILDDDDEESLWILSLGEQKVNSSFDEKEDETKDGLLRLFYDEEGLLRILSLEVPFELHFREGGRIGRVSHPLLIWIMQSGFFQNRLKSNLSMYE